MTYLDLTVCNPANRTRAWTGAVDSLVPRLCPEAIGLRHTGRRRYAAAEGREMDATVGELEIMGALSEEIASP